ncbi:MAG: hypothetical protein C4312_06335, partial [Thermoflexus sp.]
AAPLAALVAGAWLLWRRFGTAPRPDPGRLFGLGLLYLSTLVLLDRLAGAGGALGQALARVLMENLGPGGAHL